MKKFAFVVSAAALCAAALAPSALARGVEPRFDLVDPAGAPFPSDRFTVADSSQLTGLRVNLPKPDCSLQPSDCNDINVLNSLDGFGLQPRLSIPFTGPIDYEDVTSDNVFLFRLGPAPGRVGIDQVIWDPATNTISATPERQLDQDTSYLLVVTDGVRDASGDPVGTADFRRALNFGQSGDLGDKAYRADLLQALSQLEAAGVPTGRVAAASVFTTESATAEMEAVRRQLDAATPLPADFLLGANGERTVFPLAGIASIAWRRQETTAPSFTTLSVPVASLRVVAGAIGTVAFGRYRSPDYENADGVIPDVGTATGTPQVQSTNDVYFNLFLPAGAEPLGGWPVVIAGHGASGNKDTGNIPASVAATLAEHGLATIAINAVGHGGGPASTLSVKETDGTAVTLPSGGRNVDRNGDGVFGQPPGSLPEGFYTSPSGPDSTLAVRDGIRQTAIDLMQLVRQIQVGIDVNGDGSPDLDANRIYYLGNSLGGLYGTDFAALEPAVRAAVLGAAGGSLADTARLNSVGPFRAFVGRLLGLRSPSLLNLPPGSVDPINQGNTLYPFDENLPARGQQPVVETIPGASAIQVELDRLRWAMESGDPLAYAPHLRMAPFPGVPAKPVLITFAQGDPVIANTATGNLLRAGALADRTLYFRGLDAYNGNPPGGAASLHEFLGRLNTPVEAGYAREAQESVATFLASDGTTTIDPDGPGALFESPIAGALP